MDYFMYSTNEEFQTLASATVTLGYFIKDIFLIEEKQATAFVLCL